ncbi:MAG: hydrogen gas-evolving membrane-bound hydrogenase subunit E [Bacteroidota bacterium]|nr:hydrogen gas-evolving membrane-bound hydrogenase subunit E [Bacteroidota bacterium]
MMRNSLIFIVLLAFGVMIYNLYINFDGNTELNNIAQFYANEQNIQEVGAANLVTAVVVTYRGLDTLGEVTILFLTAAIIGFFLKLQLADTRSNSAKRRPSEIFDTAARVLTPIIFVFGIYVFINGHLTPGGGFQGGAIIASSFVLMLLVGQNESFKSKLFTRIESISGVVFVFIGILGIVLAGGFLDNRIMSIGTFGTLISAGAIPIIYIFVGLKVGSELSNILGGFHELQKEK